MDRKVIIYLTASFLAVICTAYLVLESDKKSDNEITITVMNSGTVEVVQTESTQTKLKTYTAVPETKTTVSSTVTVISSISTNPEQEITETQPVYSDYEVLYVDINTADAEELMLLDGIGEVTAEAIINYREENGGFRNIEEIINVYGIGEAKFEKIRGYIYVQNPVYDYEDDVFQDYEEPETVAETVEEVTETELTLENCSPIDINTADLEILMLLPYVDEQIAQDIITLRSELNGFTNVYELLYIDKLDQKQVAELTEFVTVGQ
ncbi:MAG: helix-hairpin-helix domain-containing protein [Ruminococcus sp.]|nr:helix-hairpin-helix domain-containing protein [Ruminococcus sp.]MDE6848474.1 helix-hairpin-helix domain-containing protein [Ruminococcus sp.]MDE7137436.1 helix-hairpin-helix domain-containing protein [Ruminococcus sp.]